MVKRRQIQPGDHGFRAPEPQDVHGLAAVAHNGNVIGHRQHRHGIPGDAVELPVGGGNLLHPAAELHGNGILGALDLPGIAVFQPAVRLLGLIAAHNLLPEQAEPIPDAHADPGNPQMRHGIQEAGR